MRHLREERGNVTVFVLTIFFFMVLVGFTLLFNMSTIFVDKERAANAAQQASFAATAVIYAEAEKAILAYDASMERLVDPVYIWPQVESAEESLGAAHPDWSHSEVKYQAIDEVLKENLPGNPDLFAYVQQALAEAKAQIPGLAADLIAVNEASSSGSSVQLFNGEQRIEVRTSVRYDNETFGLDFLPDFTEQVYQTGQSRRIGFVEAMGW